MSIKGKLAIILSITGIAIALIISTFMYFRSIKEVNERAMETANDLLSRATEMFMVSTKKFHDDFVKTKGDEEGRQRILDDWNRTIFAVDEAVINNFGKDKPRARLIGDVNAVGYAPLGTDKIVIEIPFEKTAIEEIKGGSSLVIEKNNKMLRVAVPLYSDVHPGCAECHFSVVESQDADMTRHILLGTLNAYVPLEAVRSTAKHNAIILSGIIMAFIGILVVIVYFFVNQNIVKTINSFSHTLDASASQVKLSSQQVSASSYALAQSSTEQAAGLQESSSTLEEMDTTTQQNAANAQQANTLATSASEAAMNSNEAMTRMSSAIRDIQQSSSETAKIIKVIDEIAFQTNLLALNAAVEAARAGEAGAGFAVVAEEVRNLAIRSAEAAKQTSEMIEQSVHKADDGVKITEEVATVLQEITDGIGKTSQIVNEIAMASEEQSQGVSQLKRTITEIDGVTQSNAANAEESASASEELNSQAVKMQNIVNDLNSLVNGDSAA